MTLLIYWILLIMFFDVCNVDSSMGKMAFVFLGFIVWVGHLIFNSIDSK